jgi:dTDP-4-amino-4,6-dideoxygalactose transaminase
MSDLSKMIPVLKPTIDEQTKKELMEVLDSGWWGQGPKTFEFEEKFADRVGSKYAIGCNSGTAALDLCLKAYGIKGGELITTPMTFVSDAIVGEWNDMDVTFADIEEDSLNLDPNAIHITPKTKAIIAVDSHGRLADIEAIKKKFDGLVIEDAAHAMHTPGAGKKADITIWSFQAVKTLPTGDGGMITTNDEKIYQKLRTLTWLGVEKSTFERAESKRYTWNYDIVQAEGLKAYMIDLIATIGLGQLRRIDELTAKRRAVQSAYNEAFREISQIKIPMYSHTVQYYTMQCQKRDDLSDYLASVGIATSVHFKPLSEMTYWKKAVKRPLPVTNRVWKKLLSLPVHHGLTWEQVEFIISSVKQFYKR